MRFLKLLICLIFFLVNGCSSKKNEELVIFHASTLALPMRHLIQGFNKLYPGVKIYTEASGSREACYKVSQLKRKADILALADYLVIKDLLMPDYADWYIGFSRNRLVICYTEHSKYASQINKDNWYKILTQPDVRFGRVNPDLAPLGYRTLMLWQLSDIYYKDEIEGKSIYDALYQNCPAQNIRHEEVELLPLLENLALDYVFEYLSVARQHNLKYLTLPKEIDLSNSDFKDYYAQAKVTLTGKTRGQFHTLYGSPIIYAVTIPADAPNRSLAIEFLKFVLGGEGRSIMEKNFQEALFPAVASDISKIPQELREFCRR